MLPQSAVPLRGGPPAGTPALLRRTLRRHAAGVTVVTVPGPAGFTATSFCSVSLEPALISFCVASGASAAPAVERAGRFAVHLLGPDDAELADRFARSDADRFAGHERLLEHDGLPLLPGVPAWLTARVVARHPAGDHVLVVGEVDAGGVREETPGLIRHDGGYAVPLRLPPTRTGRRGRHAPRGVPMQCLDCRTKDLAAPAVGVCLTCGAAVCADHAEITETADDARRGPLTGTPQRSTRRAVRCRTCGPA
ncbi:flavin reductase (DIM6/NTAB) family NADH-FMN oxidoreductase RutF [Streptomyces sp. B3I7]|uniref:DUF2180 family protein n=1 Tax=unclassified Streptomyces TaxID=2593676 RepID=UPI002782D69A|nr:MULTISPECIES: DUF2180 family protein [unclassified Streptomyces]MDQ0784841.1 flavin reductase (DIM6/NTAB) family NADH-FMN oxidoreductase RutF [Streptomyces sp. B3I8]MDQ0808620.1 flavin reductase (DIM6/NTAB) family NADH-FMN oxidoreductase RutF [Streptomyces sp. B3I7]